MLRQSLRLENRLILSYARRNEIKLHQGLATSRVSSAIENNVFLSHHINEIQCMRRSTIGAQLQQCFYSIQWIEGSISGLSDLRLFHPFSLEQVFRAPGRRTKRSITVLLLDVLDENP